MPRDPYDVLGVAREADEAQIKKSFRRLARELHPDVNAHDPEAEEKFKEAAEAYEILSDPDRRATYDRYGHEGLRSGGFAPNFDTFGSVADIFEAFFGGASPFGARRGPAPGADASLAIEIDLADAARGTSVPVDYEIVGRCEHCHGNGAEPGTPIETCERCGGHGRLQAVTRTPFGQMVQTVECDVCGGDGRVAKQPCRECSGRGRRVVHRYLEVDIPAGIGDGQRIRLSDRGHAGEAGAPDGDLYVVVSVRPDERFVRDGQDLVTLLDVPAPAAALGTRMEVPTLDGPAEVELPAGTQPGDVITVRGRGMPTLRRGGHGNLRVVVNVVIPRRLDHRQRELVQELSDSLREENIRPEESMFERLRRVLRPHSA